MLGAQIRKAALFTLLILTVVLAVDYLLNGVLFSPPGVTYSPVMTIVITLLVSPAATFYLIQQAARVEAYQASLATERAARLAEVEASRDAAEAATRAKSEFLANMSHEIRTPLNGVLGMAQALDARDLDPEVHQMVGIIRDSGANLMAILNDVLDLSKIEAGKLEITPIDASLLHTVGQVQALFMPAAAEKNLNLVLTSRLPASLLLRHDPVRVRQCVSNLVSNAVKFTHTGRVEIIISLTVGGEGRSRVSIEIVDTGIGMDTSASLRLFEAFSQADASTTRSFGGTGLGLAISRRLARMMGGDIVVRSTPGRGSAFTLTFLAEAASEMPAIPAVGNCVTSPVRLRGARVLLTDDNAINRQVVRLFLQPQGALITEAANGREALDALARQPFDLVLLDIHMPVMDGVEAIGHIRASSEDWCDVPVIALTADAMTGDRERLLSLGLNGYVSKPIEQSELHTVIGRVLGAPVTTAVAAPATAAPSVDLDGILADLDRLTG
jgi:signal transduction histidine kinase/FixJ family two-component response regulator